MLTVAEQTLRRTTPEQMQAGIIVFATVPILIVYPFLMEL